MASGRDRDTLPPTFATSATEDIAMPFVNITIYEGHPKERKDEIARRVTDTLTDVCKLPREAVWVVFNEVTPPDWYVAGNPGKK
jgi:4-oxalocrotonate tautomerase